MRTSRLAALALFVVWIPAVLVRADVVDTCPHICQEGMMGHGDTCETSWPVLGGGAGLCGFVGLLVAVLLVFAMRTAPSGKSRGD